jgi:hypothetical protein
MHLCRTLVLAASLAVLIGSFTPGPANAQATGANTPAPAAHDSSLEFRTSTKCLVCHSNLRNSKGESVSIGLEWRASIMANSANDPYWQGSVRRETLDHPEAGAAIQSECARCHMPLQYLKDKADGHDTEVFSRLPLSSANPQDAAAIEGVTCTVCHQIQSAGLGTAATYSGNFAVAGPATDPRPLFGPFAPDNDNVVHIHTLTSGYTIQHAQHIHDAALCGSCHTLFTTVNGPGGKSLGQLPEQMPYVEWLHSDYRDKQTCQQCHMPAAGEPVMVASLMGKPRDGVRLHTFDGANFLMADMLGAHRDDLGVAAQPDELAAASARTIAFLQTQSARLTLGEPQLAGGKLAFAVKVENLTGHKLPTAYPSRRAWLHVVVKAADSRILFESGKLNPDGSIAGNANDADPTRYSPHFPLITEASQVQIFEPVLGDSQGRVTTGLLSATQYLKDNRILPTGFDKQAAPPEIAVHGQAATDPAFVAGSSTTRYSIAASATGPLHVSVELLYQPVGYRWAHNLAPYQAAEPQRFVEYYNQSAAKSAVVLAHAEASSR